MKHIYVALNGLILLLLQLTAGYAQSSPNNAEVEIRRLEAEQVEYLMNGKVAEMKNNWASDHTVNNPFNVVQDAATGLIQSGVLTYSKFERNIEKILIHDSVIVVMGNELIVPKTAPKDSSYETSQPIKRRFTNVWMQKDGKWLMIARHASNICSN
ncbi:MAG: nuclear transport factor 2 family protein [Saprospiraceae bacterium]|nr:nuclear transport factor 2 family protein [Saprospiraceae bacterium]